MGFRLILAAALALPSSFVGKPNWHVVQWLKWPFAKGIEIFQWYLTWPFESHLGNFVFWWVAFNGVFVIWWGFLGGRDFFLGPRQPDTEGEHWMALETARKNKYWNEKSQRIILPRSVLEKMETRIVTLDELREKMTKIEFNGTEYYPSNFPLTRGEVGHDLKWRYRIL